MALILDANISGLSIPWTHFLSANDADALDANFVGGGIGIAGVHVGRSSAVTDEVADATNEGAGGEVKVAEDVQRKAVIMRYETKEKKV